MDYFDFEYRVRYGDTDKMGISYYANMFVWFEAARTEYFRALGLPYTECEKKGYYLPVVETGAKYLAPSTYDDLIVVRTSVSELKMSSMRFEYRVFNKASQKDLATGFSLHVFVDQNLRPVRIPDEVRKITAVFKLL
jgi:acyl-CoA thioester hydrolase